LEAAGGGKYSKFHFSGETNRRQSVRAILTDMGAPGAWPRSPLGGRYSVFATGVVHGFLLGVDPEALRGGAREMMEQRVAVEGAALNAAARDVGLIASIVWP